MHGLTQSFWVFFHTAWSGDIENNPEYNKNAWTHVHAALLRLDHISSPAICIDFWACFHKAWGLDKVNDKYDKSAWMYTQEKIQMKEKLMSGQKKNSL